MIYCIFWGVIPGRGAQSELIPLEREESILPARVIEDNPNASPIEFI